MKSSFKAANVSEEFLFYVIYVKYVQDLIRTILTGMRYKMS